MKRGKPLQGLEPEKAQIKTVLDMRYASNGRGSRAKLMVNCNGWYMPTYSLYIVNNVNFKRGIAVKKDGWKIVP